MKQAVLMIFFLGWYQDLNPGTFLMLGKCSSTKLKPRNALIILNLSTVKRGMVKFSPEKLNLKSKETAHVES